jgi:homogentisate 1,2-dioxygenase
VRAPFRREGSVAERPHLNLPAHTYEEEIGLEGFFGAVSHLYSFVPPTSWTDLKRSEFQWKPRQKKESEFLKPQCYRPFKETTSADFFSSQKTLFWNDDVHMSVHRVTQPNEIFFRNADASEVLFCHEGKLLVSTVMGSLEWKKGDYLVIPKGMTWRIEKVIEPAYLLRIESYGAAYQKPPTGILGQQALYHEQNLRTPQFEAVKNPQVQTIVRVQNAGVLTDITYGHDIRHLSGWMGDLYPFVLPTGEIAPILSNRAHLPPSVNSTFVTPQFIVCTFLPRPLEEPEGALKVPFFHSNIDYDEVIFYHAGDFFSRDHMEAGAVTLHPRGINHGPHPKALRSQVKKERTDEVAVMVDTVKPLFVSQEAASVEIGDYWKSWMS